MPVRMQCINCQGAVTVAENLRGKIIRCPHCQEPTRVPSGRRNTQLGNPPQPPPRRQTHMDDFIDPRKTRVANRGRPTMVAADYADYDEPADFEVFDEVPPPQYSRPEKSGAGIWIVSCIGIVLILGAAGAASWFIWLREPGQVAVLDTEPKEKTEAEKKKEEDDKKAAEKKEPEKQPAAVPTPPVNNDPPKVQPAAKDPKDTAKIDPKDTGIKQAPLQSALIPEGPLPNLIANHTRKTAGKSVVLLKVTAKDGSVSEGSGFLGAEPGLVFTSAHVIGKDPRSVEVTLNSGVDGLEEKAAGVDIVRDRANDLAMLRIVKAKNLPAPLPIDLESCTLSQSQPVYVLGFPVGTGAVRQVSINDTTVSSLAKEADIITQIQVESGMDAGSSGGPVIDSRGVVVGVCRAGIKNSPINFAIPADKIRGMLHGRINETTVGDVYLQNDKTRVPVSVSFLPARAPGTNVQKAQMELWTGPAGPPRPASLKPSEPNPNDSQKQVITMDLKTATAECDLELPPLPDNQVYWFQPALITNTGVQQWAQAVPFRPDGPPLEAKSAELKANTAPSERSLMLSSKFEYQDMKGKQKKIETDNIEFKVLEKLAIAPFGVKVEFQLGDGDFTAEKEGVKQPRLTEAQLVVREKTYTYQGNASGVLTSFTPPPDFSKRNYETRVEAENMSGNLSCSLQALSLGAPGKSVIRGDIWRLTSILDSGKKKSTMELTYKYLGQRQFNNKAQAFIRVNGELKASGSAGDFRDLVTGYALFDMEQGFYSKVFIQVRPEFENETPASRRFEASLERVAGNPYAIGPPMVVQGSGTNPMIDVAKITDAELDGLWVLLPKESHQAMGKSYRYGFETAIKIDGYKISWVKENGDYQALYPPGEIVLNTAKSPKNINFTSTDGPVKKWLGIYKIENDKLYIATNLDKERRPWQFLTQQEIEGAAYFVRVYKRTELPKPPEVVQNPPVNPNPPVQPPPQPPPGVDPPPMGVKPPPGVVPPQPPPQPAIDPALAQLIAELKSGDPSRAKKAANQLAKMTPSTDLKSRRAAVEALQPLLGSPDQALRTAGFHAFGIWAGKDGVPIIANLINNPQTSSNIAMDTLARLDPVAASQVLAAKLTDPTHGGHVVNVLKALGSVAEPAVIPFLNSGNHKMQVEACHILKQIGTNQSLAVLNPIAAAVIPKGKDKSLSNAARDAANAIMARKGVPLPSNLAALPVAPPVDVPPFNPGGGPPGNPGGGPPGNPGGGPPFNPGGGPPGNPGGGPPGNPGGGPPGNPGGGPPFNPGGGPPGNPGGGPPGNPGGGPPGNPGGVPPFNPGGGPPGNPGGGPPFNPGGGPPGNPGGGPPMNPDGGPPGNPGQPQPPIGQPPAQGAQSVDQVGTDFIRVLKNHAEYMEKLVADKVIIDSNFPARFQAFASESSALQNKVMGFSPQDQKTFQEKYGAECINLMKRISTATEAAMAMLPAVPGMAPPMPNFGVPLPGMQPQPPGTQPKVGG